MVAFSTYLESPLTPSTPTPPPFYHLDPSTGTQTFSPAFELWALDPLNFMETAYAFVNGKQPISGCTMLRKCFSTDTKVRIYGGGTKEVGDLVVGDRLLDENNLPVSVLSVADPEEGRMYEITFLGYDSAHSGSKRVDHKIKATGDHLLTLTPSGRKNAVLTYPTKQEKVLRKIGWATRCVTGGTRQALAREEPNLSSAGLSEPMSVEAEHDYYTRGRRRAPTEEEPVQEADCDGDATMTYDNFTQASLTPAQPSTSSAQPSTSSAQPSTSSALQPSASTSAARVPLPTPAQGSTREVIDLTQSSEPDPIPPRRDPPQPPQLSEEEEQKNDEAAEQLTQELLYGHRHRGRDLRPTSSRLNFAEEPESSEMAAKDSGHGEGEGGGELKADIDIDYSQDPQARLDDDGDVEFTTDEAYEYDPPTSASWNSSFSNFSEMSEVDVLNLMGQQGREFVEHIRTDLRERLSSKNTCSCNAFRTIMIQLKTATQALLVKNILDSPHFHLIDPFYTVDGDIIEMSVKDYATCPHLSSLKNEIKVYRCPLSVTEAIPPPQSRDLDLPPYWFGLWWGDGNRHNTGITSCDPETLVYLQRLCDDLNKSRPAGKAPLRVTSYLSHKKGDWNESIGSFSQHDTYNHNIVSSVSFNDRARHWNPLLDGLRKYGVLYDKTPGIPDVYINASEADRAALLAGLIDADGSYNGNAGNNNYTLFQQTEEHRKIASDAYKIGLSLGMTSTINNIKRYPPAGQKTFIKDGATEHDAWNVYFSGPAINKLQPFIQTPRKRIRSDAVYTNRDVRPFSIKKLPNRQEYRGFEVAGGLFQHESRTVLHNCHLNTCPVGIATQDPSLRAKFTGQPEHVINYFFYVAEELRAIMAKFGFRTINEMVGRSDLLRVDDSLRNPKTANLDLSALLKPVWQMRPNDATSKIKQQDHKLYLRLDNKFVDEAEPSLTRGLPVRIECNVVNTDRTLGTTLSNHVSKRYGEEGLPKDTIHIQTTGSAGQSLGAFLAPGITIDLEGDSNDFGGKGMSWL